MHTFSQEDSFQVVPQGDGDDGKIGGERKHRKEAEKVMNDGQVPRLTHDRLKVERVQIVEFGEGENSGERKQDVKHQNEHKIREDEPIYVMLLGYRRDERW